MLYEAGLLGDDELLPQWRTFYDKAQRPNFFYPLGPGQFLKGQAARTAQYKWAGIPPNVVKKWDRERIAAHEHPPPGTSCLTSSYR